MKKTTNKPYERPLLFVDCLQDEDVLLASGFVLGKNEGWSDEDNPWEQTSV